MSHTSGRWARGYGDLQIPILGSSVVAMVESAYASPGDHLPAPYSVSPIPWCLLIQSEMGAVVVVITDVLGEKSLQMPLIQRNDLVEQFAPAASDPALRNTILPRALDGVCTHAIFRDRIAAGTSNPCCGSGISMVRRIRLSRNRSLDRVLLPLTL